VPVYRRVGVIEGRRESEKFVGAIRRSRRADGTKPSSARSDKWIANGWFACLCSGMRFIHDSSAILGPPFIEAKSLRGFGSESRRNSRMGE
jgi:hypothetical protein